MKKFIWIFAVITIVVTIFTISCKKEEPATVPILSTTSVSNITTITADCGGNIKSDGGATITARGICWGTISNPTISNSKTTDGGGTGSFTGSLTGLTAGTKYYVRAYATNSVGTGYGNEISFSSAAIIVPTLTTTVATSITLNTATSGGTITSDGGGAITGRGVCWGTSSNPTISNTKTSDGSGNGNFTSSLTGLTPGTNYHVRAYATNSAGTGYGNEVTFPTNAINLPTLTTAAITFTDWIFVISGGNITSDGGGTITARGVCWGISSNPTVQNDTTLDGTGTGSYESLLLGLFPCTRYYVRAYATNSAGTAYGNERNFVTYPGLSILTTTEISNKTSTTASSGGNITSDGCSMILARGVCWATTPNPTINNNKTSNGAGTGSFTSSLTGLTAGTTYYVRAYATNGVGTAYGNQVSFTTNSLGLATLTTAEITNKTSTTASSGGNITADGGSAITARGVCWATELYPTTSNNKTSDGTGTGTFTSNLTGLSPNTEYFIRAYATNSGGTAYGNHKTFTTPPGLATLTTNPIISISDTSAITGGNITSDGGASVTAKGVCWALDPNPTISDHITTDGTGTGSYTSTLTDLFWDLTYYVRAYATNSEGTAYGNELIFKTLGIHFNPKLTYGTISDIDGNLYKTIKIGTQTWMAENLKTTKFNNGDPILYIDSNSEWFFPQSPKYCYYENNIAHKSSWGALYNYFTVETGRLCPVGWHVPTRAEWGILIDYLGGYNIPTALKLKETGTVHWSPTPGLIATNESGFTALPGGYREHSGSFYDIRSGGYWWTSTGGVDYPSDASFIRIDFPYEQYNWDSKTMGFSVRCLKDSK